MNNMKRDKLGRFVKGTPQPYGFKKGYKFSEESEMKRRKNISKSLKGHIITRETKQKISKAHLGKKKPYVKKNPHIFKKRNIPWNKGKEGIYSKETKKKISESLKGYKHSEETRKRMSKAFKGRKYSEETRKKMGLAKKGQHLSPKTEFGKLEKHPNWQGGLSFEPYGIEFNNKFKRAIRKRDNQVCMLCGIHREKLKKALDVHHINYDKKLTIPQNCISLCRKCHIKTNQNRKHWVKFFQSLLSEKYGYGYSLEGEIILELNNEKQKI